MPFYLFNSSTHNNKSFQKDLLVIFWTYEFGSNISDAILHGLRDKIRTFLNYNSLFDKILLLTHKNNQHQIQEIKQFFSTYEVAYSLNFDFENIIGAHFDENGNTTVVKNSINFNSIKQRVISDGIQKIFNRRGGIIGPSQNVHYILPSGKHSNIFVRIGNILKKGVEINFIGFALLPYLRSKTINIYCDTSSIAVAAQSAINLKKMINPDFVSSNIESFNSYQGVRDFDFKDSPDSLFLISVSSSGKLEDEIFNKIEGQTSDDYIITLFRSPVKKDDTELLKYKFKGRTLCDLNKIDLLIDRNLIHTFNTDDSCQLCISNSTPIEIIGDEFSTEKQETVAVVLKEKYEPQWFNLVLPILINGNYISCHRFKKKGTTEIREIYLDLNQLHKQRKKTINFNYNILFEKYLNQKLPAALGLIIYLNDEASFTIAKQIQQFYNQATNSLNKIKLKEYNEKPNFAELINKILPQSKGTILVIVGSISQSHSIVKISRDLRQAHDMGFQVAYFVAAIRTESEMEFKNIRTTLSFGKQFKAETNVFDNLLKMFIPDERHRKISPWQIEYDRLSHYLYKTNLKKFLDEKGKRAVKRFEVRLEELGNCSHTGLINNLFWEPPGNDPHQDPQKLTPGFVFFKFNHNSESVTQAGVYFTISSVLHSLRTEYKEGNQIMLQQSEHQRKILDPENFSRFNDGIIHSSILRAAYDIELDYSHDVAMSRRMSEIILNIVLKKEAATYEFLLALSLNKIKLIKSDIKSLLDNILLLSRNPSGITLVFIEMININYGKVDNELRF